MAKVIRTLYGMYDEKIENFVGGSYTQNTPFYLSESGATKALKYNHKHGYHKDAEVVEIEITSDMIKKITK